MPPFSIGPAAADDREALLHLVHSAYRGDSSRQGWTTEADLLDGQRTDRDEIDALLRDASVRVLVARAGAELVGSVVVRSIPPAASVGMLAVAPRLQGSGIGSRMLSAAEEVAAQVFGAEHLEMYVIDVRHDLIAYYARRGYEATGRTLPFPYGNPRFGVPRVSDLRFTVLEKRLRVAESRGGNEI